MKEIWKPVLGYENDYQVSNFGNVKSLKSIITKSDGVAYTRESKVLKTAIDKKGYVRCALSKVGGKLATKKVHRLVAEAFIPCGDYSLFVNHIDFNTQNNCPENLEWCTNKENVYHSIKHGRIQMKADDALRERSVNIIIKKGELNGFSKLTESKVLEIRSKYKPNIYTRKMLANEYSVSEATIKDVISKKSWKHI